MKKALVAYFSASGVTAKVAATLAEAIGAELYEIKPETPYTKSDLNWMDQNSRSTVEMQDRACRPPLADTAANVGGCDVVFVGFPVWWYREPSVIDTFMESYDFTGKTVVPFCTSGGSDIGDAGRNMQSLAPGAKVEKGRRFHAHDDAKTLADWANAWL
ncbi:MAG: flavodoxin [Oscillospiraceae bacterium]|nr:flavodoxin [Oscillospiraceae bacterium]